MRARPRAPGQAEPTYPSSEEVCFQRAKRSDELANTPGAESPAVDDTRAPPMPKRAVCNFSRAHHQSERRRRKCKSVISQRSKFASPSPLTARAVELRIERQKTLSHRIPPRVAECSAQRPLELLQRLAALAHHLLAPICPDDQPRPCIDAWVVRKTSPMASSSSTLCATACFEVPSAAASAVMRVPCGAMWGNSAAREGRIGVASVRSGSSERARSLAERAHRKRS